MIQQFAKTQSTVCIRTQMTGVSINACFMFFHQLTDITMEDSEMNSQKRECFNNNNDEPK